MALKVFENNSTNTKSEFEILQRLQDCPFVLRSFEFYENAKVCVPNSLPQDANDHCAHLRTGVSVKNDVQCMTMELCQGDFFDLIESKGSIPDRQLMSSLFY